LAFATIYIVWGSTYLGIRVAVATIPPLLMAGARYGLAGIILFVILIRKEGALPGLKQWKNQGIAGILMLFGSNGLVSWAELHTPSGITALVLGASPVSMILIEWIRPKGSRPTLVLASGVALGVLGIALMLGPNSIPEGYRPPFWSIFALFVSSINWWAGSYYSRHVQGEVSVLLASAMQMICGGLCTLLIGLVLREGRGFGISSVSSQSWIAFAALVTVGSLIAFPVYIWLLANSTPSKVSTFAYVNPVVAVLLGWAFLGEPLNMRIGLATFVIIAAVATITVGRTHRTN
jgi:drug/metabolite transporter (DMT)-like permease